jgi:hypothetical protein
VAPPATRATVAAAEVSAMTDDEAEALLLKELERR